MKTYTSFRPRLRSRHPSHSILRPTRKTLPLFPFKSVIRLGSTTDLGDTDTNGGARIEINTIEAIQNSSSKLKMKMKFSENEVMTAAWWLAVISEDGNFMFRNPVTKDEVKYEDISFPLIVKKFYGSRNNGNTKLDNLDELEDFIEDNDMSNYLFEKFHNYAREYRLHMTSEGSFYACRKVLKKDTPDEDKWFRNDAHCNWVKEDSENQELFDKPVNWDTIVKEGVKALNAVVLDVGAIDLRIQSATDGEGNKRKNPKFVVIEINSAPSFGEVTGQKYIEILPQILKRKHKLL